VTRARRAGVWRGVSGGGDNGSNAGDGRGVGDGDARGRRIFGRRWLGGGRGRGGAAAAARAPGSAGAASGGAARARRHAVRADGAGPPPARLVRPREAKRQRAVDFYSLALRGVLSLRTLGAARRGCADGFSARARTQTIVRNSLRARTQAGLDESGRSGVQSLCGARVTASGGTAPVRGWHDQLSQSSREIVREQREQAVAAVHPAPRARTVAALRRSAGVSCAQWSRWEPRLRLPPHVPSPPRPAPCGSLTRVAAGSRVPLNHGAAGTERGSPAPPLLPESGGVCTQAARHG
jgi:hypothetical protein